MSNQTIQVPPEWAELDEQAMADVDGGGPLAEFVYDAVHTTVSAVRFVYDLPRRLFGLPPGAALSGGGTGGGW